MAKITTRGVLAGLMVLAVAAVCVRLGFWQLDRLEERRARNAALAAGLTLPVVELTPRTAAAVFREPEAFVNRRVRVRGAYEPQGEVVLRGRSLEGRPGVHLVTPLRIGSGDTAVLVNRGWAPSPDAATVDPARLAEPGTQVVEGVLQRVPRAGAEAEPIFREPGGTRVLTLRRLDRELMGARVPGVLLPVYVQQLPGPVARAEPPQRVPLPEMDEGPHLGYAVQWFGFAAVAVVGFLVAVVYRGRT